MGIPNNVTVHVDGAPAPTGTQDGQGGGLITGENFTLLLSMFGGKQVDGAPPPDGAISQATLKIMLGPNFDGKLEIDITFPKLAAADEVLVTIAIEMFGGLGLDENSPISILIKVIREGVESGDDAEGSSEVDKTKQTGGKGPPIPPQVACAFLGGLVMVALSELLQEYAKQQSGMEKLMSEMWVETEAMLKDMAKVMAENILKKAETQATSHILQAVLAACACVASCIGAGAAMGSMTKSAQAAGTAAQKAATFNALGGAASSAFKDVAGGIVRAWESLAVGDIDASQKIMENVEQQLQKMVDKYSSEGSEAGKRVSDALDLLKNMISALLNAFKSFAGGHS
ncbi:MAG: hypothetical protein H0T62_06085 [Parachlamydiaceae bacterium]|nr:hypothetical protein [Parachlamydiaceae bacterium]